MSRSRLRFSFFVLMISALSIRAGEVTPEQVVEQKKAFQEERKAALDQKYTEQGLLRADELAKKADKAIEKKEYGDAYKYLHDARWQVPYLPPELPKHVVRVFGQSRMRHGDLVRSVAINKSGTLVASASRDGTVKIWDLANGREARTYRGHKGDVRAVAWSPDGEWVASAGTEIHLWNAKTGELKKTLKAERKEKEKDREFNSISFGPDGKFLASAGEDALIRVWDLEKGEEAMRFDAQNARVYQVAYSPNGKLIASANGDGTMAVWNTDSAKDAKRMVLRQSEHNNGTFAVAYDHDGKAIFTGGGDKSAHKVGATGPGGELFDKITGVRLKEFTEAGNGHTGRVISLAVSPDGKTLVTGAEDNTIRIWDVAAAKVIRVLKDHNNHVTSLAISADGSTLVSGSNDHTIRVWSLDLNDPHRTLTDHKGYIWSAVPSPDGTLIASAGADRTIRVWNVETGLVQSTLPGHGVAVTSLCFSTDGTKIVSGGGDKLVKLWDWKSGKLIREFQGHAAPVMAVAIGKDGKQLLSGSADKSAKLWNIESPEAAHTFSCKSPVSAVAIRDDGKQALVGTADGYLRIVELGRTPKELTSMFTHQSGVSSLAYSPDSKRIVTGGGDRLVKVQNAPDSGLSGNPVELRGHAQPVSSVAFSPDGQLIVSAGGDLVVRVWNAATMLESRALRGHTDWVASVAFAPDGKSIVSAGVDKTVKIWDLTPEETLAATGHTLPVRCLAVDPTGKLLATGSEDRTIKLWNMETGFVEATLSGHSADVTAVTFDPKEGRLLSGSKDMKLLTWDVKSRKVVSTLNTDEASALIYTPSGDKLLAWLTRPGTELSRANLAQAFDRDGKAIAQVAERSREVRCLSFSVDGELVALGYPDGIVKLWNLTKGEKIGGDFPVSTKNVADIAMTNDKTKLITADEDSEVRVWEIQKRGEPLKKFKAHNLPCYTILLSPDGKRLATVADNEVKLWDADEFKELRSWSLPTNVKGLTFTADGKSIVTANGDATLFLLELP